MKILLFSLMIFFVISCNHQDNTTAIQELRLTMEEATRRMSLELAIPEAKVCIGGIKYDSPFQKPLHDYFVQEFEVSLATTMHLVEQNRLRELIEQQKFQTNDFFDQSNFKKIGKFASVDYIILGTMQERSIDYEVVTKIIELETAFVKKISRMYIGKDQIPSHVVREMARSELLSKGYKELAEGTKGEIISYFKSPAPHVRSGSAGSQPLGMKLKAFKKVNNNVQILHDGDVLHKNDQYRFQLMVNQPAYVYAIHLAPNQKLTPLFCSGQPIPQNQLVNIPGGNTEQWLQVQDEKGIGQLGLLVTLQPMQQLDTLLEDWTSNDSPGASIQEPCLIYSEEAIIRANKGEEDLEELSEIKVTTIADSIIYPVWYEAE